MKTKILFLLAFVWMWIGCSDSESNNAMLQVSPTEFNQIKGEGEMISTSVTCPSDWRVVSNQTWCIPSITHGKGNSELQLMIHPNPSTKERKATVTFMATKANATIHITQLPQSHSQATGETHYQLPVIFHVLYANPNDRYQYIAKGRLEEILSACNLAYKNKKYRNSSLNISQDMNLEFVLATHKPDGTPLEEPGVERLSWPTMPLSCEHFMEEHTQNSNNKATEYAKLLWNPKMYINIFVYPFTEKEVLGISHMPYVISSHALAGLNTGDYFLTHDVDYPHCISLNSKHIYTHSTDTRYYTTDVYNTLIHELGHYLGLLHAFSEKNGNTDLCEDTDYCMDTPTYNHTEYNNYLLSIPENEFKSMTLATLCKRKDCSGHTFTSHNYMDYAFCYSDQFTPQQRDRIRHVLSYGTLTPGPKQYTSAQTRSLTCDKRPEVQIIK